MMKWTRFVDVKIIVTLLFTIYAATASAAGSNHRVSVKGNVYDMFTMEPLSYVTVTGGKNANTLTDSLGHFSLFVPDNAVINVKSMGYRTEKIKGPFGKEPLTILLEPSSTELAELVVKPKKQKYSKKNNPAVDLMQQVRHNYRDLAPDKINGYNYDTYAKMVLGLSTNDENKGQWILPVRDKKRLANLVDTAVWTGERIIALSVKEQSGVHLRNRGRDVDLITGTRGDGIDKSLSDDYTDIILRDLMREVNVYDNDIMLVRNAFMSPLSRIADDFYKFEITDTVQIGDDRCVELSFAPHKAEMTGFNGKLYVPVNDSIKYVRRVMMRLPKAANINYVTGMVLSQNYKLDSVGRIHKTLDDLIVHVRLVPGMPVFYVSRQSRRDNFGYQGRPEFAQYTTQVGNEFVVDNATERDESFWEESRRVPLSYAEQSLYSKESVFKKDKIFKVFNTAVNIVSRRYIPTGNEAHNYFNIGPWMSMLAYSKAEGWRVEVGGMTTSLVSPHFWVSGYGAYGFGDHKWKYRAQLDYTLRAKKKTPLEFPMNNFRAAYMYDIENIGQFKDPELSALLSSWRTGQDDYFIYKAEALFQYDKEWQNHLGLSVGFRYNRDYSTKTVQFVNGFGQVFDRLNQAIFYAQLRWAPGEKFTQSLDLRSPVNRDGWVFVLKHEYGPKKMFGARFNYSRTDLAIDKGFWLSSFGYLEGKIRASKIWTQVPFTSLNWPPANSSYFTDGHSFVLMKAMEFAVDEYAMWDFQYHARNLILDRIPYVKKAKFREFFSFKGMFGGLTKKNNPKHATGALKFPDPNTGVMNATPYMECSVGIENILTFLRVEYVWRLTYRHRPDIDHGGVRLGFHVTF